MGKILSEYIEEIKEAYSEAGLAYSPNSIYHGAVTVRMSEKARLKASRERLSDFIEFLFEHSEHCDHISQSDAWKEFEQYEFKTNYNKYEKH